MLIDESTGGKVVLVLMYGMMSEYGYYSALILAAIQFFIWLADGPAPPVIAKTKKLQLAFSTSV